MYLMLSIFMYHLFVSLTFENAWIDETNTSVSLYCTIINGVSSSQACEISLVSGSSVQVGICYTLDTSLSVFDTFIESTNYNLNCLSISSYAEVISLTRYGTRCVKHCLCILLHI